MAVGGDVIVDGGEEPQEREAAFGEGAGAQALEDGEGAGSKVWGFGEEVGDLPEGFFFGTGLIQVGHLNTYFLCGALQNCRIIAHHQQVVRVDREVSGEIPRALQERLWSQVEKILPNVQNIWEDFCF